jgi:hypothetical protein
MVLKTMPGFVDPAIKKLIEKFFHLIYLHLYFEVNARVSQLYQEMMERGVSTKEEFLNILYKSKPWGDAKMLTDFNAEDFLKDLSKEKTKNFIEKWDEASLWNQFQCQQKKTLIYFLNFLKTVSIKKVKFLKEKHIVYMMLLQTNR